MADEARPGLVIAGRYQLAAELGSGGFGRVWQARDQVLGVDVAVKQVQLPPAASAAERAERLKRAEREARNAARLRDHPNIVAVHDVVIADGTPWIVMRLVNGRSMADRVEADGPLSPAEAARVAAGLLRALGAAEQAGVAHRDVKPGNVLLTEGGEVLLADFGIAAHSDDTALTATGMLIGSIEYTAPERLEGMDRGTVSDLFSLGATLHQAVEGCSPFRRDNAKACMAAILFHQPPPPRNGGALADLIAGLLDKDPDNRPTVAQAVAQADAAAASAGTTASVAPVAPSRGTRILTTPQSARWAPAGRNAKPSNLALRFHLYHWSRVLLTAIVFAIALPLPLASTFYDDKETGVRVTSETYYASLSYPWSAVTGTDWNPEGRFIVATFVIGTPLFITLVAIRPLLKSRFSAKLNPFFAVWIPYVGLVIIAETISCFIRKDVPNHQGLVLHASLLPGAWLVWLASGIALVALAKGSPFRMIRAGHR